MEEKRTTIAIQENLLREAKQVALDEDKTLKELVNEALINRLKRPVQKKKAPPKKFPFKAYHMGKIKGTLRRVEIYDWL